MIEYRASRIYAPGEMEGSEDSDFFAATITVDGDSDDTHFGAICCWGVTEKEATERRGLILAALSQLSMVKVTQ